MPYQPSEPVTASPRIAMRERAFTDPEVARRRRSVDFQSHFQALAQKAALAFFCYGCGKPIFIHCECEGFQDILVQPWDLPPAVPSSGTPADKMWWHAALMSL